MHAAGLINIYTFRALQHLKKDNQLTLIGVYKNKLYKHNELK